MTKLFFLPPFYSKWDCIEGSGTHQEGPCASRDLVFTTRKAAAAAASDDPESEVTFIEVRSWSGGDVLEVIVQSDECFTFGFFGTRAAAAAFITKQRRAEFEMADADEDGQRHVDDFIICNLKVVAGGLASGIAAGGLMASGFAAGLMSPADSASAAAIAAAVKASGTSGIVDLTGEEV